MKTWCDDAITGVKQEKGGNKEEESGKKGVSGGSFSRLVALTTRGLVFFLGDGSHTLLIPPIKTKLSLLFGV